MSWESVLKKSFKGAEGYLRSNQAVNKIYGYADKLVEGKLGRATGDTMKAFSSKEGAEALNYTRGDMLRFGLSTYAAASVAGRAVSGGGVYKDSQGNFDVAGIPFI